MTFATALVDVDGTLIDSNYWHLAAWQQAFAEAGVWQPAWRVHTYIGMGGDRLVAAVAGDQVEDELGDRLRESWKRFYDQLLPNVRPFPASADLLRGLKQRGLTVVLASSGATEHLDAARAWMDADDAIDGVTSKDDVESSKPAGDLFQVALEKAGGGAAFVIGDSPWDAQAAGHLPVPMIGLRCGGFSEPVLIEQGVAVVRDDPADLLAHLDETLAKLG